MSRAKTKRPVTRKSALTIPNEVLAATELALDDLLSNATPSGPSPRGAVGQPVDELDVIDELLDDRTRERGRASTRAPTRGADEDEPDPELDLGEPALLRFAIFEDADHLAAARSAIVAAGHAVAINMSSAAGAAKITAAITAGEVDAVLVALPGGESIIAAALALEPQRPLVIAACAGKATSAVKRAIASGCDLVAPRPHDAERVAPILLAAQRLHRERRIAHAARGAELVLRAKLDELTDPDLRGLQPFEAFRRVLELELQRVRRFGYPLSVALFALGTDGAGDITPPASLRGILRARAGNALIHTIRDIDIATQLDHERFLVLLPYTELTGAAGLARRVIAAVAAGDAVVAGGRSFSPRVVGAAAQAKQGEPLGFARLMKDATRALDQARRDGAELAVQP